MNAQALVLLLTACNPRTVTTDYYNDNQGTFVDVAARLSALADVDDARSAGLEAQCVTTSTALDGLAPTLGGMSVQVEAFSASFASGTTRGRRSSRSNLGSDLGLSVTRVDTSLAWWNAVRSSSFTALRISLTHADGGWTMTSTTSKLLNYSADTLVPVVAALTPPEMRDYMLIGAVWLLSGWTQYARVAVQAGGVGGVEDFASRTMFREALVEEMHQRIRHDGHGDA